MAAFAYQYIVGGIIFLIGLAYAAKQGYIGFRGRQGLALALLLGGFVGFASLQGYLQFAPMPTAAPVEYEGGYVHKDRIGTGLDYGVMVAYFLGILAVGTYFAKNQKTTKDFFFGGQRFAWWLISFSLIATTVGSYSFVKYSEAGYEYGLSSSMSYLNDWFWMPLLVFGWLPLLYFSKVTSVPEYFERRFGPSVRAGATVLILTYLIGYVGVNLFTMGKALNVMIGWPIITAAIVVAVISSIYVAAGGQTSVIMTDLFQGIMLLGTGIVILFLGISYLGGFDIFWSHLPRPFRAAFSNFNERPQFNAVGVFWQDGIANSAMFYFLNQGIIMRFMSARSVQDARKAALVTPLVLMVLAAVATASGGWIARAMVHAGVLPPDLKASDAFFVTTELLSRPGLFGLIAATLIAALMSSVDTLVTAVAAIFVNDVYKPYIRPAAEDRETLRVARVTTVVVMLIGVLCVPVFMQFASVYEAHGAFTAAVTPPLVMTLLFSVFWRRFTRTAALFTMFGGLLAVILSGFFPELITPFAHGVPRGGTGGGFFDGMRQHAFMRACYGIVVCGVIGVITTLFTKSEPFEGMRGLVWGTVADAIQQFKGRAGGETISVRFPAMPVQSSAEDRAANGRSVVDISAPLAQALDAREGDLVYLCDSRWWLGGLRSQHAVVGAIVPSEDHEMKVAMSSFTYETVAGKARSGRPVLVQRQY
jgi:SSS family solute:Na+ symporter